MEKLLRPNCTISGELFYITDGNPTSTDFVGDPLKNYAMNHNFIKKLFSTIPFLPVQIPEKLAATYSYVFSFLSLCLGKNFRMPIWGFTRMELKKVFLIFEMNCSNLRKLRNEF